MQPDRYVRPARLFLQPHDNPPTAHIDARAHEGVNPVGQVSTKLVPSNVHESNLEPPTE
jgi:hypothetical protein